MSQTPTSPGQLIARRFRRLYLIALTLIAALAIGGQVLVQLALRRQSGDGHVVNKAGYQRMLSQRLTLKMILFSPQQPDAPAQLVAITAMRDRWRTTHQELIAGLPRSAYGGAARAALASLLDDAGQPLERISALAAALSPTRGLDAREQAALLADQEIFLPLMDAVVLGLDHSAAARVSFLQGVELTLLFVTLAVLGLEALLIFQPIAVRLQSSLDQLDLRNRQTARRLESLRHLTGGIAHTFNNLLTAIMGHAQLERLDAQRDGRSTEYIDAQLASGRRAAAIITQLTRYSGESSYRLEPVALAGWLRSALPAAAPDHPAPKIALEVTEDATAAIDRSALSAALHGLLANATEAMTDKSGVIRIRLDQVMFSEPRVMSGPYRAELPSGLYACLQIIDTGEGIDPADFDRIFDPYYSRRAFGRGLGLASILGIVHGHGGGICVESSLGRGSVVIVYLPLISPATPPATPSQRSQKGSDF